MFQVLEYPQGTVFYDSLSDFDILVSAFLTCCAPTLIVPEVLTSGRVTITSPGLNFLLNWIQNQNGSLSLY